MFHRRQSQLSRTHYPVPSFQDISEQSCPCAASKHTSAAQPALWASHHPPFQETDMGRSITMCLFVAHLYTAINVAKIDAIPYGLIHIAKDTPQKLAINKFPCFE